MNRQDNINYRNEIISIINSFNLTDAWRDLYPTTKRYTWHSRGKAARLDYFLISEHLMNDLITYKIIPGLHSDHSILIITLNNSNKNRGRGFWKFNCNLLHDKIYVKTVKDILSECKKKYTNMTDKGLIWELCKLEIRSFSVPYCIKKKKERSAFKRSLEEELEKLLVLLDQNLDKDTLNSYNLNKKELQDIEREETNAIIFRSKVKWIEEGEKNTKYFLNLEKNNYTNKLITNLEVNGKLISDPNNISKELTYFYKDLYTEKLNEQDNSYNNSTNLFLENSDIPKLSELQKDFCERQVTEAEILSNLKNLNNGKTPGTDGLPTDFYKFFYIDIKKILFDSITYAMNNGELSIEQKRSIITLLPKKNKNKLYIKNWRPISLLNTDYKLIAKIFASRLQNVLPSVINYDQSGYLKNRYIGQNIRLLEDVSTYTNFYNLPGIIFSIDFEKAFDSINWSFLLKTLKCFNFGTKFISYIRTMYNNIESTVINNGTSDKFFKLHRGVRQGCPLSAYLFIIAIEILAIKVRNNPDIKGIKIGHQELKISLLADDITLLLKNIESVTETLNTLKFFHSCSGLKINIDKSHAKYIGSLTTCDYFPHGLSWIKTPLFTLGIHIVTDPEVNYKFNFSQKNHKPICQPKHLETKEFISERKNNSYK